MLGGGKWCCVGVNILRLKEHENLTVGAAAWVYWGMDTQCFGGMKKAKQCERGDGHDPMKKLAPR